MGKNIPSVIDHVGLSLEAWSALTDQQQRERLKQVFEGKNKEEIKEILSEIAVDIKLEREELRDMLRDIRRDSRPRRGNMSEAQKEAINETIEEVKALQDELKEYKVLAEEIATNYNRHQIPANTGQDVAVSGLELDGEPYTYTLGGSGGPQSSPFAKKHEADVLKEVTSDGTETGDVIKDVNLDGQKNYADIEEALRVKKEETIQASQKVFIQTQPDQNWMLVSADPASGHYTFKVEDKEGNFSFVTFENAKDVTFYFSAGISDKTIAMVRQTWPTDLLKRCYWHSEQESFYDRFFGKEVSQEERLGVISGYDEVKATFNEAYEAWTVHSNKGKQDYQKAYDELIKDLYATLDDPNEAKDVLIDQVWEKHLAQWQKAGFNEFAIQDMIRFALYSFATQAKDQFQTFFKPAINMLEQAMLTEKLVHPVNQLVTILLLELQAGPGLYGGESVLNDLSVIPLEFSTVEKIKALQQLEDFLIKAGMPVPPRIAALKKELVDAMTEEDKIEATGGYYQMSSNERDVLLSHCLEYGERYGADLTDGIYEEELAVMLDVIVRQLYANGEKVPVGALREVILKMIGIAEEDQQDELAATLLQLLHDKAPGLFDKLMGAKSFRNAMWKFVDNGGNDPENYYQIREWINGDWWADWPIFDDTATMAIDYAKDWGDAFPVFGHIGGFVVGGLLGLATDIGDGLSDAYNAVADGLGDAYDYVTDW